MRTLHFTLYTLVQFIGSNISSWKTKYLFQPKDNNDIWITAYYDDKITPYSIRSLSSLIGRELLKSIQTGLGPTSIIELKYKKNDKIKYQRITPHKYLKLMNDNDIKKREKTKIHLAHFTEFCRTLCQASSNGRSGENFCLISDLDNASIYLSKPPYHSTWSFCWCGLIVYLIPIIINGEIYGVIYGGQRRLDDPKNHPNSDKTIKEKIKNASKIFNFNSNDMIKLAFNENDLKKVNKDKINEDIKKREAIAKYIKMEAEAKYISERRVRESLFLEEIMVKFADVASESLKNESEFLLKTNDVLTRILEFLGCFDSVAILKEISIGSYKFRVAASKGKINLDFINEIPKKSFDDVMPDRIGPLLFDKKIRPDLYKCLSNKLVTYKIKLGYVIRMFLKSNYQLLLILTVGKHTCKFKATRNFCQYRQQEYSNLGRDFLTQLGSVLTKEFDLLVFVENLKEEENRREAFLERVAHSLSLPMQSIRVDAANLVNEVDAKCNQEAKHLFNETQGLELVVENILHGGDQETKYGQTDFKFRSILEPLKEACEMFSSEAKDKGCDIKSFITIGEDEFLINPLYLDNEFVLYKIILIDPLLDRIGYYKGKYIKRENIYIQIIYPNTITNISLEKLALKCFDLLKDESESNIKKIKIKFNIFDKEIFLSPTEVSKYYMPYIEMNSRILSLAFKNLIHNAVKYSYRTVTKSSRRYVRIICKINNLDNYEISFQNYGVCITNNELESGKIWENRYRGLLSWDRNRTGAGLGLSHVKWAIENIHKGHVDCICRKLEGACLVTFIIKIPIKQNLD